MRIESRTARIAVYLCEHTKLRSQEEKVLFRSLFLKPLAATPHTAQRSDGRTILLKVINGRLGLNARPAACLSGYRPASSGKNSRSTSATGVSD
jgi:hypothetical protein